MSSGRILWLEQLGGLDGGRGAVAVEALAVEVADPRGEPQAEEVVGAEDHLGVAVRVGRVLGDRQHRLVVEDPVERVGGVADGGGHDLAGVLAVLVGGPRVDLQAAAAVPEVARQRRDPGPRVRLANRCPSEEDSRPAPHSWASGRPWW